jgi:hypothetical protein
MKNSNKSPGTEKGSTKSGAGLTLLIIISCVAAAPVMLYLYFAIQQSIHWQSGAEYVFMTLFPIVIIGSVVLFINGSVFLLRAARNRNLTKRKRVLLICLSVVPLLPGLFFGYQLGGYQFAVWNATRVISNQQALDLVQKCDVDEITRGVADLVGESHTLVGKVYLKNSAQNPLEKQSYFYGYRTFAASYYDELFKIAQSQAIREKCGSINYSDNTREGLPPTAKWATMEEAKQMMDSCSINEVFTNQRLETPLESQTSNPANPTGIFMTLRPSSHGYFGRLYIASADQSTRDAILDFANKKKPVCVYHLPNIIESTY